MVLIVVIGLLCVIGLLILPRMPCPGRARIQTAKTQVNAFAVALEMFKAENGHYPRGSKGLEGLVTAPNDANNWRQPMDPWGNKYVYQFPGRHNLNGFDLMSMGPDGKPGTSDDITNWQPRN
jgi:general secretion pathway protein G